MQYDDSKIKEYIKLLDTISKEYDFEYESASFFQIDKIKPELFVKKSIDEKDALIIIYALLEHEIMPDSFDDYTEISLIELAIKNECSVEFIKEIIELSCDYNLDVVGVASQCIKLMIEKDCYSFNDLFLVINKFFEYGYNYLNECEKKYNILTYFRNSSKFNLKRFAKLLDFGKKGYRDYIDDDLLIMFKYVEVKPINIVNYLFSNIEDYGDKNRELICNFFKCSLDNKVKIINDISEINFEIPKNSKAYNGLKTVLDIILSEKVSIYPEALYNLYCSLVVQNDIHLLNSILYLFKYNCDFDIDYYGTSLLTVASNKLNDKDYYKLKNTLIAYGYKEGKHLKTNRKVEFVKKIDENRLYNANPNENDKTNIEEQRIINELNEDFKNQGIVLNFKKYISMPGVERESELESVYLGLARRNGSVILVGESGVGKTEIANRLAWQIQNDQCPNFLKGRLVVEISLNSLIAGCMYRGSFEEKMQELFKKTKKYNAIVVINEIHNIFGFGSSSENNFDLSEMLKTEIEEGNIQVIGTTTKEEYERYFANSALKRRFKKVDVKELDSDHLFDVFYKVIIDLCELYNIELDSNMDLTQLIDIIIRNTEYKHRKYNDRVNNPALGISIIEDAFAYVIVNDKNVLSINEFIEAFNSQDRIYDTTKDLAIKELNNLIVKVKKTKHSNVIDIRTLKRNKK